MRASGAGWASVGAGTILVLIGALILAVVSTVVAFQGWPGASGSASAATPTALLAAGADAGRVIDSGLTGTAVRVPAARRAPASPSPRPARRTGGEGPAATAPRRAAVVEPAATPVVREPAGADVESADSLAPAGPARDGLDSTAETVRKAGDALGSTLGDTVGGVGQAAAPVSPTLGTVVDDVGAVVDDMVQGVTDSLGVVLETLSGAPGG